MVVRENGGILEEWRVWIWREREREGGVIRSSGGEGCWRREIYRDRAG